MRRPIAVDLFSGAGGMSLGFEQAGFDVVAAVEVDPIHAAVHKFNFPKCTTLCRDVSRLTGDEIRTAAALGKRKVDLVMGGAPCQGFSLIGHRALDDPRNSLVNDFVRLVGELDARYFVFENVKGLTVGKHKAFLTELIATFQAQGYAVEKRWQVLNAAHYGVPQSRERLILFGAKKGLRIPKYPIPSNTLVNCKDALSDLPDADKFASLFEADEIKLALREFRKPSKYAQKMRCLSNNAWEYGYRRVWDPQILTSSMRTEHTAISRRRFSETKEGEVEPISRFFKLPSNGLSNTLRAGTDGSRGAFTSPRPIHYRYNRCVTVREMARLHGFPDWFRLHATKWHGAREIGNAVPPPLAKAIGCSIMAALNRKPIRPTEDLSLGNVDLLRLNLKAAAKYWGIEKPNGRRDRKSGAKKRRQDQIELELQAQLFAAE